MPVLTKTDPDKQAVLLLCSHFGQLGSGYPQPLSISDYNRLAHNLKNAGLRPSSLLDKTALNDWLHDPRTTDLKLQPERIQALLERGGLMGLVLERWQAQGIWMICRFEDHYPQLLKHHLRDQAPPILYGVGNRDILQQGGLALVGSRDADEEALDYTQRIVETCARDAWPVISGGAKGVDRVAMLGTLNAGGQSVGVLPDSILKAAVTRYYRPGLKEGSLVLISPFDPEAGWLSSRAMQRNKYVYGLADAALVISSATDGGTWQGATEALKHHPTWQVPVFVRTEGSLPPGNNQLITQGGIPFPTSPWASPLRELLSTCESSPQQPTLISDLLQLDLFKSGSLPTAPEANGKDLSHPATDPRLPPLPTPRDIYTAVLPFILADLQKPRGLKELAASLDIKEGQAKAWLERAVRDGHLKLVKKKYIVAS